jgi:glycosyltransferase involved in cell wall biosynthesis
MRILQIGKYYSPEKGGIETHLRALSSRLQEYAEVEVVVAGGRLPATEHIDGIKVERLATPLTALGTPICPQLIARLRRTDVDLVHIHLPNPWAAFAYLMSGCQCPLVVSYHSDIVRQSYIEPAFRPILHQFLKRASLIICSSENLIKFSCTLRKFRDRCVVVPYGIDPKQTSHADPVKVNEILKTQKKPIVLAVGRLVYYKGFEYLLAAMTKVDAALIIVGKGPRKNILMELISDLGLADKVTILDQVEDVAPYYHAAEIFVLPSIARSEAFGIVQIEAMAAGKPVINTDLPSGVPIVSQHGVTGLTVQPANWLALASAINQLLDDPELCRRYGNAACQRVQENFHISDMVSLTWKVYLAATARAEALAGRPFRLKAAAGK